MRVHLDVPDRGFQAFLIAAFLLSRALFFRLGIRLDTDNLYTMWQIVDPVWLRKDLAETLFYLHGQPPLFNFIVGLVAKLPESAWAPVWTGIFMCLGLALCLTIFHLCRAFSFSRLSATAIAFLFTITPQAILYENWLLYTYPTALLLTLGALLAVHYLRTGTSLSLWGMVAAFVCVCLMRSMFHLVWIMVLFGFIWWGTLLAGYARPRAARALVTGIVIVSSVYCKNFLLFGSFSASSWFGMTFLQTVYYERNWAWPERAYVAVKPEVVERLLEQRELSLASKYGAFSQRISEDETLKELLRRPNVRLLANPAKSRSRYTNYNYEPYIEFSRMSARDAMVLLRHDAGVYLSNIASNAFRYFFKPSYDYVFLSDNARHIGAWNKFFYALLIRESLSEHPMVTQASDVAEGRADRFRAWREEWHAAYLLAFTVIVALVFSLHKGLQAALAAVAGKTALHQFEWLIISWIMLWACVVPILLSGFEAHRMRFMIEPLLVVTFLIAARNAFQIARKSLAPRRSSSVGLKNRR